MSAGGHRDARRWMFHVVRATDIGWGREGRYAPESLAREGFVHASYQEAVASSARLYFGEDERESLRVMAIDPRRLDAPVEVTETPRGPMPHIHGAIPVDAVHMLSLDEVDAHSAHVSGTRVALLAYHGMALLDLVGPLEALSRICSMGFDRTTTCEVVSLTRRDEPGDAGYPPVVWSAWGAELVTARYRPALDAFDVIVVPGGPGARAVGRDEGALDWLASYPNNRIVASVCGGALVLGAAGRIEGKRATTHHATLAELERFGAIAVADRVVDDGQVITAAGPGAGIELGLHLVERLAGPRARAMIAAEIEAPAR